MDWKMISKKIKENHQPESNTSGIPYIAWVCIKSGIIKYLLIDKFLTYTKVQEALSFTGHS